MSSGPGADDPASKKPRTDHAGVASGPPQAPTQEAMLQAASPADVTFAFVSKTFPQNGFSLVATDPNNESTSIFVHSSVADPNFLAKGQPVAFKVLTNSKGQMQATAPFWRLAGLGKTEQGAPIKWGQFHGHVSMVLPDGSGFAQSNDVKETFKGVVKQEVKVGQDAFISQNVIQICGLQAGDVIRFNVQGLTSTGVPQVIVPLWKECKGMAVPPGGLNTASGAAPTTTAGQLPAAAPATVSPAAAIAAQQLASVLAGGSAASGASGGAVVVPPPAAPLAAANLGGVGAAGSANGGCLGLPGLSPLQSTTGPAAAPGLTVAPVLAGLAPSLPGALQGLPSPGSAVLGAVPSGAPLPGAVLDSSSGQPQLESLLAPLYVGCVTKVDVEKQFSLFFCPDSGSQKPVFCHHSVVSPSMLAENDFVAFPIIWSAQGDPQASTPFWKMVGSTEWMKTLKFGNYLGKVSKANSNGSGFFKSAQCMAEHGRDAYAHKTIMEGAALNEGDYAAFDVHQNPQGMPQVSEPLWKCMTPQALEKAMGWDQPNGGKGRPQAQVKLPPARLLPGPVPAPVAPGGLPALAGLATPGLLQGLLPGTAPGAGLAAAPPAVPGAAGGAGLPVQLPPMAAGSPALAAAVAAVPGLQAALAAAPGLAGPGGQLLLRPG